MKIQKNNEIAAYGLGITQQDLAFLTCSEIAIFKTIKKIESGKGNITLSIDS